MAFHRELPEGQAATFGPGDVDGLQLPSVALRKPLVHAVQVSGPKARLIASGGRPQFHDDILGVVGILRHEEQPQVLL